MNYEGYYVTLNKMYGMCGMYMEGHIKDISITTKEVLSKNLDMKRTCKFDM